MHSVFIHVGRRFELLRRIREAGYGVRMHAYEYYVWRDGFVSIIFLQPNFGRAYIYRVGSDREKSLRAAEKISNMLKSMDKSLKIEIIGGGSIESSRLPPHRTPLRV